MPSAIQLRLAAPFEELLRRLVALFDARGVAAYASGGFLRDAILGLPLHDLDISISGDPLEVGPQVADAFGGDYFPLDEERRLVRLLLPDRGVQLDILPLRGDIGDDLRGRDYTVDAMAASLQEVAGGQIDLIDPTGGLRDLRAGLIRAVSEQAFVEDPLRLLRGARLATQLDFQVEEGTAALIRRHAATVTTAAVERQRDELIRTLSTPRAATGLRLMEGLGLLCHVLPELNVVRDVAQPKEHHWDVFGHSLEAVAALDVILGEEAPAGDGVAQELWAELWGQLGWWDDARDYFRRQVVAGSPRSAVLKLGGLLHDIGKPETKSFDETGRMRFFGHSDAGADIASRLLGRLHFSSRESDLVRTMIKAHLRPLQMSQSASGRPSDRAIYRFFRDCGDAAIDTLFLSLADHRATVGPRLSMEGWRQHAALVNYILTKRFRETAVVQPPKLLRGDELMSELGLAPGPQIGQMLEVIREAQAAGEVTTKEEALELARSALASGRLAKDIT